MTSPSMNATLMPTTKLPYETLPNQNLHVPAPLRQTLCSSKPHLALLPLRTSSVATFTNSSPICSAPNTSDLPFIDLPCLTGTQFTVSPCTLCTKTPSAVFTTAELGTTK